MFILQTFPFVKPVSRAFLQQARAFSSFIFIGRHFTRRSLEGQTENCPIPTDEKRCRKSRHLQFFRHSVKGRESVTCYCQCLGPGLSQTNDCAKGSGKHWPSPQLVQQFTVVRGSCAAKAVAPKASIMTTTSTSATVFFIFFSPFLF